MYPRIGIVIVNLNSYDDTSRCLKSLEGLTYPNVEVVVVDNGSQDGSAKKLREDFPDIIHVSLPSNLGSTGGRNVGIHYMIDAGCDHVLLIDDDAIATPNFLDPLVKRLESDPNIAAVTGKILKYSQDGTQKPKIIWFAGCERKWHTWFNHRGDGLPDGGQFNTASVIPAMPACLMLMRGSVIRAIGAFSDDYFVYWEETDWCARAIKAGYTCYYEPKSIIYHDYKSGVPGKETAFYNYLEFRNALIYNKNNNSFGKRIQFTVALPLLIARRFFVDIRAKNPLGAYAVIWGVYDYFRGFRGEQNLKVRGLLKN
jgi:GT2 family glycosyltransferase